MEKQFSPIVNEPIAPDEGKQVNKTNASILKSDVEVPLSLRETPYTLEFFKVDAEKYVVSDIGVIESYIINQIQNRNLVDNIESYQQVIQEILDKLGVEENELDESKIEKVFNYIQLIGRNKPIEEKRQELIEQKKIEQEKRREQILNKTKIKLKEKEKETQEKEEELKVMRDKIELLNKEKEKNILLKDKLAQKDKHTNKLENELSNMQNNILQLTQKNQEMMNKLQDNRLRIEKLLAENNKMKNETANERYVNQKRHTELERELFKVKKSEEALKIKQEKLKKLL